MIDINLNRLQEITIILYGLSVLFYFIDFLQNNRKAHKAAFWFLSIVWLMQTIFLCLYMFEVGRFPVLTLFEGLYFYVWILITFSLILNRIIRTDFFMFFTNVIGFGLMVIHIFSTLESYSTAEAQTKVLSELSMIHITVAILSYAAFALSFVFSILYLIQYDLLKRKKWGKRLNRLGDLAKLEQLSYILVAIGVPLLLLSLILGLEWAYIIVSDINWYDSKILGSFACLIIYGIYLYLKVNNRIYGKSLAYWNIGSFLLVLVNFFFFGSISAFHVY
ncbi:cytochrome C assembly protein [Pradoshia sp. D12]|uniref:cytochrome C assembly family protein n=1 Tax=Bacillaceae TaxID=186817 RepID=UPI00080AEE7E|nr:MULTISPECIES: cytochrome c biogenesis protein [Bacillaceae]OCA86558.1 cytochrome C assembly protein [Bacillus sp. FJAT-27986]QFK72361.1 cytochrome C assembly protein [Pradoshia sp. D12]TPF71146.1 cytochrome C assembly protein [Bacillus sp. D12]